ncbi:MAG: tail fiber domain-containing protein [Flavobacterium sp. JAD_PAG50586_2]|nr:MAG: tail fiber domain-containing protein [Flavobacterium sp. JAD_PAG50586_2]
MKKLYFLFILLSQFITAQVGINTTDPKAQLEIKSSNQLTPSNTDGLLIPKIDAFPTANPTIAQQGMLVYLNTTIGTNQPGFYYWDNPTTTWLPIKGNNGVTLDQAYDFGGAGNGKTITADAGAVLIDGTDGLISTGTIGSGALALSGAGTRMVWNPRKAAFRAGKVGFNEWDDAKIGQYSIAFGESTEATGMHSVALGWFSRATGSISTAFGGANIASGDFSAAFGNGTSASGAFSTAFGQSTFASGHYSTAFGMQQSAKSLGEVVLGIGATDYIPSTNGNTQFRTANATDRLFVIGNAIDANNNTIVDNAERSDALIILKNGLTRLPSTTNTMINAADGKAVVTKEYLQNNTSGTLDQAYDFGGAGLGKTITADAGAVLIDGTDGLVSTGVSLTGAVAPSGAGTRMVWNPRKSAFRAGLVLGTQSDDVNMGAASVAMGNNCTASGLASVAIGNFAIASGVGSTALGTSSAAFGQSSTVFGRSNIANSNESTAFGYNNSTFSYGETVLGIGATTYVPISNFSFANSAATDRLFVVGNAIDTNVNGFVDTAERSDALVILKNGATGIGTSLPNALLDVNATDNGILIPRVILSSVLVQTPVVNPRSGVLPVSTLVYNTATAGVSPNNVYPGFYYWNGIKWIRFDVDGENNPRYYTVVGTTTDLSTTAFTLLDQMSITFTPKDDVVMVNFSAAGHRGDDSCQNNAIFFQILLNGIPVSGWQTSSYQAYVDSSGFSSDDITSWDTNISYPITVPIGISQTVQIQWYAPNCTMFNSPASVVVLDSSTFKSYRTLTIIDPNGGGGIVGSSPVTTNLWAHNGNAGTNAATNFVGTADNQPLVLKSNNIEGLRIGTSGNVGVGTALPLDKFHITGNIRMVDGNQAAGKVLTSDVNGRATWENIPVVPNNEWSLTGNSGTTPTTHFIGTTDNNDLVFKRFSIQGGIIGTTNTSFGLAALNPASTGFNNTAIGSNSLDVNTLGFDNIAAGFNALGGNTIGSNNTALGVAAMITNTSGNFNTAIGRSALFDNTTGSNNTATGYNALSNVTTGINNTAVGTNAFSAINAGNNNTALGADTSLTSTIFENATAIGYKATAGNNNVMVLGSINGVNGATSSVNVGIGTISPQTALEVVDVNVTTTPTIEGTINVLTNGAQAIDTGGSITLGGNTTDAGTTSRTFASIEGRKATATTGVSSGYLLLKTNNGVLLTERMRITNAGDVGIGLAAPGGQFELSLNEGRKPTSNTWIIPSDARLKNVDGVYQKGLTEILQLKPIRYHYKNTAERTFDPKVLDKEAYGFLAQEVQQVFPEAVGTDPDGYLNFDLHPILIASINALKELDAKNTELKAENEKLKEKIRQHDQQIATILAELEKRK